MNRTSAIVVGVLALVLLAGLFTPVVASDDEAAEIIAQIVALDEACQEDLAAAGSISEMNQIAKECNKSIKSLIKQLKKLGVDVDRFKRCVTNTFDGKEHTACYDPIHVN